jgi:hypothetical protein
MARAKVKKPVVWPPKVPKHVQAHLDDVCLCNSGGDPRPVVMGAFIFRKCKACGKTVLRKIP